MTTYPAEYCPQCGSSLTTRELEGRERQYCTACDRVEYRNPVPCAGVAVVGDDGVLLTKRAVEPDVGSWTVPGGHLEHGEDPATAGARELREEIGLRVDPDALTLLDTLSLRPFPGKHVVSIGYAVRAEQTAGTLSAGPEVTEVGWFTPDDLSEVDAKATHVSRFQRAWDRLGTD